MTNFFGDYYLSSLTDVELTSNVDKRDGLGLTKLHRAARAGDFRSTMLLLSAGASIDAKSNDEYESTPLQLACYASQLDMVAFLLRNGAQLEARDTLG